MFFPLQIPTAPYWGSQNVPWPVGKCNLSSASWVSSQLDRPGRPPQKAIQNAPPPKTTSAGSFWHREVAILLQVPPVCQSFAPCVLVQTFCGEACTCSRFLSVTTQSVWQQVSVGTCIEWLNESFALSLISLFIFCILQPAHWFSYRRHSLTCPCELVNKTSSGKQLSLYSRLAVHSFPAENHGFRFGVADPHPHHITLDRTHLKQALKITAWHGANVLIAGIFFVFTSFLPQCFAVATSEQSLWVWPRLRAQQRSQIYQLYSSHVSAWSCGDSGGPLKQPP